MRSNCFALGLAIAAGVALGAGVVGGQAPNMAHTHIGHVMTSFGDTPDKAGLLPTASAEAATAAQHAALGAKASTNLMSMQNHAGHVIQCIDPAIVAMGPCKGYGVKKAATAQKLRAATTAEQAAPLAADLQRLSAELSAGADGNKDGNIGWQAGEGGLTVATTHMQLMMKGEGIQ